MPPRIFPTGVTISLPGKAEETYVLYEAGDVQSVLIDMNGDEAHRWDYSGAPPEVIDPALVGGERGRIFVQKEEQRFANETLLELDWDGNVVWEWGAAAPGGKARQHHEQIRLANGNTLVLSVALQPVPGISEEPRPVDAIYEVRPDGSIEWEWFSPPHLEALGFTGEWFAGLTDMAMRGHGGAGALLGLNSMRELGSNKWYDGGDERFHPINLVVGSRSHSFVAVISRATGEIVWNVGPEYPATLDLTKRDFRGPMPRPIDCFGGQHDVHMIAKDSPGEGNFLVFDNQGATGAPPKYASMFSGSRVVEVDPISKDIVWQYDGASSGHQIWSFYSSFMCSARRLPGGNTLIAEGMYGRIFQVTREGEIVWEFVNPRFDDRMALPGDAQSDRNNQIYRAQPVPYDWVPEGTPRGHDPVVPEGF